MATTRASVLRGSTTDTLGDEVDDNTDSVVPGYEDLPASIIETSKAVYDPASGARRVVRVVAGRLPATVQLEEGDRLKDNRTGRVYPITAFTGTPRSIAGQSSLTLDLTGA